MVLLVSRGSFGKVQFLFVAVGIAVSLAFVVQQELRSGANDPQEQLGADRAAQLNAGAAAGSLVTGPTVDLATSLAPFIVVYDAAGKVLATNGALDGAPPLISGGVLSVSLGPAGL
jgi:hypothetical protein